MSRETKKLVEEATERRIEKICEFHWRRVFGEGIELTCQGGENEE